jgi:hypothetical protein
MCVTDGNALHVARRGLLFFFFCLVEPMRNDSTTTCYTQSATHPHTNGIIRHLWLNYIPVLPKRKCLPIITGRHFKKKEIERMKRGVVKLKITIFILLLDNVLGGRVISNTQNVCAKRLIRTYLRIMNPATCNNYAVFSVSDYKKPVG